MKIKFTTSENGKVISVVEREVSEEQAKRVSEFFKKIQSDKKERHKEIMSKVNPDHIKILRIYNEKGKKETLRLYPEYAEFINSIKPGS